MPPQIHLQRTLQTPKTISKIRAAASEQMIPYLTSPCAHPTVRPPALRMPAIYQGVARLGFRKTDIRYLEVGADLQGQMDFEMVHAPAAEEKFVSEVYELRACSAVH